MKHLLLEAKSEIERLRRQNEILGAKVEVMNLFGTVLHTYPAHAEGAMSVDIAWSLQKEIERLEAADALPRQEAVSVVLARFPDAVCVPGGELGFQVRSATSDTARRLGDGYTDDQAWKSAAEFLLSRPDLDDRPKHPGRMNA